MHQIRATNIYEFVKCPRIVYLNFFEDPEKKHALSEFMQKKAEQGREYEIEAIKGMNFVKPDNNISKEEAFKQTLEFMKQGKDLIYQGTLISGNLIGMPDFLEKTKGQSEFGDYHYQACDIKLGKHIKDEYLMQVMFYSYLLYKLQGVLPAKAFLLLKNNQRAGINVKEHYDKFSAILENLNKIALGIEEPVHIGSKCKECIWRELCFEKAIKEKSLALIYSITKAKLDILKQNRIKDLEDAANMDIERLLETKEFTKETLEKYKLQARSLLEKRAFKLKSHKFPKQTSIYFDIEDTEVGDDKIVYLFGLYIDGKYSYFLADDPSKEREAWRKFLSFFETIEEFKLYVYSPHEATMLKKLFKKYGGDELLYSKIQANIIDLFKVVKETSIFPIYSYTVKDVAKYLGFKWSAKEAGGAQSILWYDKWLETKNRKYLNEVLRYNEEDCKAMAAIKEWIER